MLFDALVPPAGMSENGSVAGARIVTPGVVVDRRSDVLQSKNYKISALVRFESPVAVIISRSFADAETSFFDHRPCRRNSQTR